MGNVYALLEGAAGLCGGFAILGALILLGWLLIWNIAIKHLPPVQEALGWRRPLKPPRSEKAAEIAALKAEHARIRAALRAEPHIPAEVVAIVQEVDDFTEALTDAIFADAPQEPPDYTATDKKND